MGSEAVVSGADTVAGINGTNVPIDLTNIDGSGTDATSGRCNIAIVNCQLCKFGRSGQQSICWRDATNSPYFN